MTRSVKFENEEVIAFQSYGIVKLVLSFFIWCFHRFNLRNYL